MKIYIYLTCIILCNTIRADDYYEDDDNNNKHQNDDKEESLHAKLELIDMDLEDLCDEMAVNLRRSLTETPVNFSQKILIENNYGNYLKSQQSEINVGETNYDFQRNISLLNKSGDWLLPETTLLKLLNYYNMFEESHYNYEELDEIVNKNISKQDFLDVLITSRNKTVLQNLWSAWQFALLYGEPYKPILHIASKAAASNDYYNVKEYWEKLVEYDDAYNKADELWIAIEPLYAKLQKFVLNRINAHYKTNYTYIPAYLTGTNFGEDWSNIADILMPHPQLMYDINFKLKGKSNRDAFVLAEKMTKELGLGGFGKKFWSKSYFNLNLCANKINTYCAQKYSEVLTCNTLNWSKYLNAHESAMRVVLNNKDYVALMRMKLRYSAFDDALISLSSIFAIEHLTFNGILSSDAYNEEVNEQNKMSALLLAALRTLPQLPYYLAADKWRLDELEHDSVNLTSTWWQYRIKYQGIQGFSNKEPDFMTDSHFIANKPYVSKFFGLILQFQLLDYYQVGLFNEDSQVFTSFNEDNFRSSILDRPNKGGTDFLLYHYGINEISADALLNYFEPLQQYLDTFADHREPIITRKIEPTTTTTTTTTEIPKIIKSVVIDPINTSVLKDTNDTLEVAQELETTSKPNELMPNMSPNEENTNKANSYIIIIILASIVAASVIVYFIYKYTKKRRKFQRNRRENTDV